MRQIIRKKWFGYTLYGLLLAVGLLYYRFPSEAVRDYLRVSAERLNPQISLSIGRVSPSLTFGLRFFKTELAREGDPEKILFQGDSLLVRPSLWSLFQGKLKLYLDGLAYKGVLKGWVHFTKNSLGPPFTASMGLKEMQVGESKGLSSLMGRKIEGSLYGTLKYSAPSNRFMEGNGEADLRLSGGRIELMQPILSFDAIDFSDLLIKMSLKNRRINLARVELKGQNMNGTLSGTINLRRDFQNSTLNLKGNIEPFADLLKDITGSDDILIMLKQRMKKGTLSFVVRGTIAAPKFTFT